MPKRVSALGAVGLGIAAVVAIALVLGAITIITRGSGPQTRVASDEGGVSVVVPNDWVVVKKHPTDPKHQEFLSGHENAALGFLQRGGFWVARWAATDATTLTSLHKDMLKGASVTRTRVGPYPAILERYSQPPRGLDKLRLGDTHIVVRELIARGYVYQVGTWALPHAGSVDGKLDDLGRSLEIVAPRPWTSRHLTLPGGWVQRHSDLPGATFFAMAPHDPTDAWVYVFHYRDSPAATLRAAQSKIPQHGGTLGEKRDDALGGRKAIRLDFTFPDRGHAAAHDVEWFAGDGRGGTFVLAVGRRAGDEQVHERLAATWRF